MLDYNHTANLADNINARIDEALVSEHARQPERDYLGASRLGVACERALQFEYAHAPKDDGRAFTGRTLRIFAAGHLFEDMVIGWLRKAGFDLLTQKPSGEQFGFSVAGERIRGHVDGIIMDAPDNILAGVPALWECKSLNARSWRDTVKRGVSISKPVYAAQIAIYQAYMETSVPGISANPALFTAINKDTAELYHELVPFDGALAQRMSDKAVRIIRATQAGDLLPRIATSPDFHECRFCDWQNRCWRICPEVLAQ
jgi:hypothetical protein